ncbi:ATP-binding protein [Streptomyces sp. NBC_01381]|uniref:ATP-binding protein n=1 Tax=Streptomyces sp. NBC_01381 TaxID=2903845 RepID=UPI002250F380|nr:ATP-binding protein [Streptomyces sp. NBC_01381]MCX4673177.1 ATP-binding protein [Streptomyces sp. NBC_01381]
MQTRSAAAAAHLALRYGAVHRALRAAAARRAKRSALLAGAELSPYCVTDEQAGLLLDVTDPAVVHPLSQPVEPPAAQTRAEHELRRRAAAEGISLPLDALARAADLDSFECDALLLCLAPALAPEHSLLFGYLLDDLDQRRPTAELILTVLAPSPTERCNRLPALGPYGRLRRFGLLIQDGDPESYGGPEPSGADLLRSLHVRPELPAFLLHGLGDPGLLVHDPGGMLAPLPGLLDGPTRQRIERLAAHLRAHPAGIAALWGLPDGSQADAAYAVAERAGLALRHAPDLEMCRTPNEVRAATGRALAAAAALGTGLWLPSDRFHDPDARWAAASVCDILTRSGTPVVLTGQTPWRPLGLLSSGRYAEESAAEPGYQERRDLWSTATASAATEAGPAPHVLDDLAARFRLSPAQLRAAVRLAASGGMSLDAAVARVLAALPGRIADVRTPARGAPDLVLPAEQARQISELAAAFRAWPKVSQEWGFGGQHGGPGLKALFTGEPGTGKSLAAEVVAAILGVDLVRVDLAQTVSKWVGETEKNLDEAFSHAEAANALLLFDEADAVFGKRGTVSRGTDRYANLEVGYLLQRLEHSPALVVLTTNLQGNLDEAFTRRFQFVVHFTRPGERERTRLWRMAFPQHAPLDPQLSLAGLARLDLTGAAIMATARGAALLAAERGSLVIDRDHLAEALTRQFRQESRLPRSGELDLALGPLPVRDSGTPAASATPCVLP